MLEADSRREESETLYDTVFPVFVDAGKTAVIESVIASDIYMLS